MEWPVNCRSGFQKIIMLSLLYVDQEVNRINITKNDDGSVNLEIKLTKEQYEELAFNLNTREVVYCLEEKDKEKMLKGYLDRMFYLCDSCNQLEHLQNKYPWVESWKFYSKYDLDKEEEY